MKFGRLRRMDKFTPYIWKQRNLRKKIFYIPGRPHIVARGLRRITVQSRRRKASEGTSWVVADEKSVWSRLCGSAVSSARKAPKKTKIEKKKRRYPLIEILGTRYPFREHIISLSFLIEQILCLIRCSNSKHISLWAQLPTSGTNDTYECSIRLKNSTRKKILSDYLGEIFTTGETREMLAPPFLEALVILSPTRFHQANGKWPKNGRSYRGATRSN